LPCQNLNQSLRCSGLLGVQQRTPDLDMIVCPNCNHQNPDDAEACEACFTPLPKTITCPNCDAIVPIDASFCGHCGFNLQASLPIKAPQPQVSSVPPTIVPLAPPLSKGGATSTSAPNTGSPSTTPPAPVNAPLVRSVPPLSTSPATQLQKHTAKLLHVQTHTIVELPAHVSVIHLGKPNSKIPPDVDVSGFPNSEIVSRVHANIRVEGDLYYIEDVGSSNGTYINNLPLQIGDRHRLRPGDRIALGKSDLVTFLFQLS
jgi:ribosomal protein L40E